SVAHPLAGKSTVDEAGDGASSARIPVSDRDAPVPLSLGQKRLWFLDQFVADSAEYLIPLAHRLIGELDLPALAAALREIVARHEILRTSVVVVDDEPVGMV